MPRHRYLGHQDRGRFDIESLGRLEVIAHALGGKHLRDVGTWKYARRAHVSIYLFKTESAARRFEEKVRERGFRLASAEHQRAPDPLKAYVMVPHWSNR